MIYEKKLILWNKLSEDYFRFNKIYKKYLYENYGIDCGTDYANYVFNDIGIKL